MYTRILAPIDASLTASHAFDEALKIAHETGANLQPLFVIDRPPVGGDASTAFYPDIREAFQKEGVARSADAAERTKRAGVPVRLGGRGRADRRRPRPAHSQERRGIWRGPGRDGNARPARLAAARARQRG